MPYIQIPPLSLLLAGMKNPENTKPPFCSGLVKPTGATWVKERTYSITEPSLMLTCQIQLMRHSESSQKV